MDEKGAGICCIESLGILCVLPLLRGLQVHHVQLGARLYVILGISDFALEITMLLLLPDALRSLYRSFYRFGNEGGFHSKNRFDH